MQLPWKIGWKLLTSGADSGIIKMGKAKNQFLTHTPADFSKYTISGDIESVQVAKNSLIFSFESINNRYLYCDGG